METKRRIPYGVINWAELVRECFFVDNTSYIRNLEGVATPIFLRPKRFGKSIVCSMLAHYYDINLKDRFDELFGKTDIGRNPTPLRNSFLVLQFDFSTVQVGTLAEIERNFWSNVQRAVGSLAVKYRELADWSRIESAMGPAECIDKVRDVIRENNLPPLYVIIDEYDNFTNELVVSNRDIEYNAVCGHDSRGDATRESFFKAFLKSFKAGLADGTVGRTYFTGVLPITLDDLSSGYNVGTVVSINPELMNLAGFTYKEKRRNSFEYDVTALLKRGVGETNVLAAVLTSGWWSDGILGKTGGKENAFRGELRLEYANGSVEVVATDESWVGARRGAVHWAGIWEYEIPEGASAVVAVPGRKPVVCKPGKYTETFPSAQN